MDLSQSEVEYSQEDEDDTSLFTEAEIIQKMGFSNSIVLKVGSPSKKKDKAKTVPKQQKSYHKEEPIILDPIDESNLILPVDMELLEISLGKTLSH